MTLSLPARNDGRGLEHFHLPTCFFLNICSPVFFSFFLLYNSYRISSEHESINVELFDGFFRQAGLLVGPFTSRTHFPKNEAISSFASKMRSRQLSVKNVRPPSVYGARSHARARHSDSRLKHLERRRLRPFVRL